MVFNVSYLEKDHEDPHIFCVYLMATVDPSLPCCMQVLKAYQARKSLRSLNLFSFSTNRNVYKCFFVSKSVKSSEF